MNAKTVEKLLVGLGFDPEKIHVKGERSDNSRWFTVTLEDEADHPRAAEVKAAVLKLTEEKGFAGGCDVVPAYNFLGKVLA